MPPPESTVVACLCAAWCRTCDDYNTVFETLKQGNPGCRFVWIDIEDEADLVGDIDVETFPTLLVGVGHELRFFGPVTPQLGTAQRVLNAALAAPMASPSEPAALALLAHLQSTI